MNINILGKAKVRWMGAETFTWSNKMIIYSSGEAHFRGVGITFDT